MNVSVVVPAFNSGKTIKECIESILGQDFKGFELIIVNDASTDSTGKILEAYGQRIRVIENKENLGSSSSRNIGAKSAGKEFVAFMDSDCVAERDWLKNAVKELKEKKLGVLQGRVETNRKGLFYHFNELLESNGSFLSSNLFVKKSLFQGAGGFDEGFRTFREDSDLLIRLKELNAEIGFSSKARVFHPAKKRSFWDVLKFQKRYLNEVLFARKHPTEFREMQENMKPWFFSPLSRYRSVNAFIFFSVSLFFLGKALLFWFFGAVYLASVLFGLEMAVKEKQNTSSLNLFALAFLNPLIFIATFYWFWVGSIKFKKIIV